MNKTIKVNDLKMRIERLVNDAIDFQREGNREMFDYCYNKAIAFLNLIDDLCIDCTKEHIELKNWFDRITYDAIFK